MILNLRHNASKRLDLPTPHHEKGMGRGALTLSHGLYAVNDWWESEGHFLQW